MYTPVAGTFRLKKEIGDIVCAGEVIAHIDDVEIVASISGILRGLLPNNFKVRKGLKMADIDPRKEELDNCYKISEKARCISGAVLETILVYLKNRENV